MRTKGLWSILLVFTVLLGSLVSMPSAQAYRHHRYYYDQNHRMVDYKTGKILKGGLVGAGIGAGTGLLMDGNVGRNILIGAGLGAGTQAVRYSSTMRRHPIVKTASYGALAGVGVSSLTRRANLGRGAAVGSLLGAGLGVLRN